MRFWMKLQIKITQKHIKKGKAGSCLKCPIALAVSEKINKWWPLQRYHVRVYTESVVILNLWKKDGTEGYNQVAMLPQIAETFIKDFDYKRLPLKPFEFELDFM